MVQRNSLAKKARSGLFYWLAVIIAIIFATQAVYFLSGYGSKQVSWNGQSAQQIWDFNTSYSLPPEETAGLFFTSQLFGGLSLEGYWGKVPFRIHDDYLGISSLIFVLMAFFTRRKKMFFFFLGGFILTVLLAYGKYTPLYQLVYRLPLMSSGRNPIRWLMPAAFFWSVLVALGGQVLSEPGKVAETKPEKVFYLISGLLIIIGLAYFLISLEMSGRLSILFRIWEPGLPGVVGFFRLKLIAQALLRGFVFLFLSAGCFFLIFKNKKHSKENLNGFTSYRWKNC